MITDLPTKKSYSSAITVTVSWHRYETKLRHCHPMYSMYTLCSEKFQDNTSFVRCRFVNDMARSNPDFALY